MPLRNTNHDSNRPDWWHLVSEKFQRWIVGLFVEISVGRCEWNLEKDTLNSHVRKPLFRECINTVSPFSIFQVLVTLEFYQQKNCLHKSFVPMERNVHRKLNGSTEYQSIVTNATVLTIYTHKSEWNYSRSIRNKQQRQVDVHSQSGEIPARDTRSSGHVP